MSTRRVKDAVDSTTNETIYFKGHAKATYMSDGNTVEDTINLANNELQHKQDNLVSGDNIKTIGGASLLGSGDIEKIACGTWN